tara:strand:+ start:1923 stop:2960 length:1038 start_codon:yes stop_codon:yes gene_type:complete
MSDNLLLSDLNIISLQTQDIADICNSRHHILQTSAKSDPDVDAVSTLEFYLSQSTASETRRAYGADLRHFAGWGGEIPAGPKLVATYLCECAGNLGLAVSTIKRRVAAIAWAHREEGLDDPTKTEIVRKAIRGIERHHGNTPKQAVPLFLRDIESMGRVLLGRARDRRDMGLMLVGYFGGFRGSELVGLNVEDFFSDESGLLIKLGKSKTDQTARGRWISIPAGGDDLCPVKAVADWLAMLNRDEGPMFPSISRYGNISEKALTVRSLTRILLKRAEAAGMNADGLSSHSIRAGFVTESIAQGEQPMLVANQTGHSSPEMLARYLRPVTREMRRMQGKHDENSPD